MIALWPFLFLDILGEVGSLFRYLLPSGIIRFYHGSGLSANQGAVFLHESFRIFETKIRNARVQGAQRPCRGAGCIAI